MAGALVAGGMLPESRFSEPLVLLALYLVLLDDDWAERYVQARSVLEAADLAQASFAAGGFFDANEPDDAWTLTVLPLRTAAGRTDSPAVLNPVPHGKVTFDLFRDGAGQLQRRLAETVAA